MVHKETEAQKRSENRKKDKLRIQAEVARFSWHVCCLRMVRAEGHEEETKREREKRECESQMLSQAPR
jgi:hypothetical protein